MWSIFSSRISPFLSISFSIAFKGCSSFSSIVNESLIRHFDYKCNSFLYMCNEYSTFCQYFPNYHSAFKDKN